MTGIKLYNRRIDYSLINANTLEYCISMAIITLIIYSCRIVGEEVFCEWLTSEFIEFIEFIERERLALVLLMYHEWFLIFEKLKNIIDTLIIFYYSKFITYVYT
jgi:hypothetical protein